MFGPGVHLVGTHLELHLFALGPDDRCVQRLVQIELGHCHVVLEPALHRLPGGVDGAQRGITVAHVLHDDPYSNQVVDLFERSPFHDHLLVDAPELLRPAVDIAGDPDLAKAAFHLTD